MTAISGGTGSGKSTLINLIPRFYDVDSGSILVDGVDIREMTQKDLRAKIGFVPQTLVLFSGTISENIRYMDEVEQTPDREDAVIIKFPKGQVKFEHVNFGYKEDAPLLEDLSIDIEAGQTTAIVGPTGAGKTTIVNLIMRFYEVQGGRITIDGVDIRDMKRGDLRL